MRMISVIGELSVEQVLAAADIAASGLHGKPLRQFLEESDLRVRTLIRVNLNFKISWTSPFFLI